MEPNFPQRVTETHVSTSFLTNQHFFYDKLKQVSTLFFKTNERYCKNKFSLMADMTSETHLFCMLFQKHQGNNIEPSFLLMPNLSKGTLYRTQFRRCTAWFNRLVANTFGSARVIPSKSFQTC